MPTLLLSKMEVKQLLDVDHLLPLLKNAFIKHSLERTIPVQKHRSSLPDSLNSSVVLFPGYTPTLPVYTVKVHAKHPNYPPSIKGVLLLHDLKTGELLAIMDSTYLTAVRTGLTAALATHHLANPSADTLTIIGAGVQGVYQLRYITKFRKIKQVFVYDTNHRQAQTFTDTMTEEIGIPLIVTKSLTKALSSSSIIMTATWSKKPFIFANTISPGTHITSLGSDEPNKNELDIDLIRNSLFICDDRELTLKSGALFNHQSHSSTIDAELGDVLAGRHPGRTQESEITIFSSVGLAFQDLVAAWSVYQKAIDNKNKYRNITL
ncbi:ornithine cyclodeaminase [Marininema mesophilum]|uniref:Ornithine cyclodeaminase n=1 Tax=Marininema mesophilum TaxID=1048340 RepID=A0A1H3CGU5_9BACL|nr:ornithine cyclodeaminase family protein [Marininema mesophilum]SDX53371.1 ornithine cyclodeaminase [Marininema mesophilum]